MRARRLSRGTGFGLLLLRATFTFSTHLLSGHNNTGANYQNHVLNSSQERNRDNLVRDELFRFPNLGRGGSTSIKWAWWRGFIGHSSALFLFFIFIANIQFHLPAAKLSDPRFSSRPFPTEPSSSATRRFEYRVHPCPHSDKLSTTNELI